MTLPPEIIEKYVVCDMCGKPLSLSSEKIKCACGRQAFLKGGRVFFTAPPAIEENTKSAHYGDWSPQRRAHYDFFERSLPKDTSLSLLDIGAGPTQFQKLFLRFSVYCGLDFYPYEHVSVVSDFNECLPLRDNAFDIVVLSNLLEHVPDAQRVLKEAHRTVAPRGLCLATIPFLMRVHQAPYDYNRFTLYQLKRLFENAGFTDVRVEPLGLPMHVYRSIQRHFFGHLLDALKERKNLTGFILYPLAYGARILMSALFRIFKPLYAMAMPNERFTEGDGVYARKP